MLIRQHQHIERTIMAEQENDNDGSPAASLLSSLQLVDSSTATTRLHVEISPELSQWMQRTFHSRADMKSERFVHLRHVLLYRTDVVKQILDVKIVALFPALSRLLSTHEDRLEALSQGAASVMRSVGAPTVAEDGNGSAPAQEEANQRRRGVTAGMVIPFMHPLVPYLKDNQVTSAMIASLHAALVAWIKILTLRGPTVRIGNGNQLVTDIIRKVFQMLSAIALRGDKVRSLFLRNNRIDALLTATSDFIKSNLRNQNILFAATDDACITLTSLATLTDGNHSVLVEPAIIFFSWKQTLNRDSDETLSQSISHLAHVKLASSTEQQPPEILLTIVFGYLRLCFHSASSHVRLLGAIHVTVLLEALSSSLSLYPTNTPWVQHIQEIPAAQVYLREARLARLCQEATRLGCSMDRLQSSSTYHQQPLAFLAECILSLRCDTAASVRSVGNVAQLRLPRRVLQQAVWSPSRHRAYGKHVQDMVVTTLLALQQQQQHHGIPVELLVDHVFPYACVVVP